jgi:hypothetical protein
MASLSEIITAIREAKDLIVNQAPDFLDRSAEIADKISGLCHDASEYLKTIRDGKMKADADTAAQQDILEKLAEECQDLAKTPVPHLRASAKKSGTDVPPKAQAGAAGWLSALCDRILECCHEAEGDADEEDSENE